MTATENSKWAAILPSSVLAVQPSSSIFTRQLPAVIIGSMAMTSPGFINLPTSGHSIVRNLGVLMEVATDTVADEIANDSESGGLCSPLYGSAHVPEATVRSDLGHGIFKALTGRFHQVASVFGYPPDPERNCRVTKKSIEYDTAVHTHQISLVQPHTTVRDPVDNDVVDGNAQGGRKTPVTLEGGFSAFFSNQLLGHHDRDPMS